MDSKALGALKESIEIYQGHIAKAEKLKPHWQLKVLEDRQDRSWFRVGQYTFKFGPIDCPVCAYVKNQCYDCPISEYSDNWGCCDTPWEEYGYADLFTSEGFDLLTIAEFKKGLQAELDFLKKVYRHYTEGEK